MTLDRRNKAWAPTTLDIFLWVSRFSQTHREILLRLPRISLRPAEAPRPSVPDEIRQEPDREPGVHTKERDQEVHRRRAPEVDIGKRRALHPRQAVLQVTTASPIAAGEAGRHGVRSHAAALCPRPSTSKIIIHLDPISPEPIHGFNECGPRAALKPRGRAPAIL